MKHDFYDSCCVRQLSLLMSISAFVSAALEYGGVLKEQVEAVLPILDVVERYLLGEEQAPTHGEFSRTALLHRHY